MTMMNFKIVYVKNVGCDSIRLLQSLMELKKPVSLNKDTFTLKNITQQEYNYLLALKEKIKFENKDIIISHE
jgi:hypothetical protein